MNKIKNIWYKLYRSGYMELVLHAVITGIIAGLVVVLI